MAEKYSLKDDLFNQSRVEYLAGLFAGQDAGFDADAFVARVMSRMLDLELLARVAWISEVLAEFLPDDFAQAATVIEAALPAQLDPSKTDDDFGSFIFAPFGDFAVTRGLDDFERSMALIHAVTRRFSMEFAMRHFILAHTDACMKQMDAWMQDENYHVRRLVSECTRPSLPWGKKIGLDVVVPMVFLNRLHTDPTRFVTRSVANHLNDISKSDADLVVATLTRWANEGRQDAREMDWITRHSLRTLVKRGHQGALELLGYRSEPAVNISGFSVSPSVKMGGYLEFSAVITAQADERLMVDFVIDFIKANGQAKGKVFKLKQIQLMAGEDHGLVKRHRLMGNASTFKIYPGAHRVHLQVNGIIMASADFDLIT